MNQKQQNGSAFAIWRKCDFQIHSPRDPGWKGPRPAGAGDARADGSIVDSPAMVADRQAWARDFVDALESRGLNAIAITDHHEMVMIPYVQEEIASRNADIWLFPGMEITAKGGAQCLLLFDVDLEQKWWTQAQGMLGIVHAQTNEASARGNSVVPLDIAYPEIDHLLKKVPELSGRYIVLPNISDGGPNTVLKKGAHADFRAMTCVGGYLDRGQTIDTLKGTARRRLSGKEEAWGGRELYPLPTSDSRESDFTALGTNGTWIKLAVPTAEAIRQAFLGHRSRIAITAPETTSLCLRSLTVTKTRIISDGSFSISPELNVLIGGRGAGKSAFLEYLAFALGRSAYDLDKDDYSENDRLRSVIADTVIAASATIRVEIEQDGARFTIERSAKNAYEPTLTYPSGEESQVSAAELRKLFPAVVYSQGELSEIGKKAGGAANFHDLLQFVEPQSVSESRQLSDNLNKQKAEVGAKLRNLVSYWELEDQIGGTKRTLSALDERIKALAASLPKLEVAEQATLDDYNQRSAFDEGRIRAVSHAEQIKTDIDALVDSLGKPRELPAYEQSDASALAKAYREHYDNAQEGLKALKAKAELSLKKIQAAAEGWKTSFSASKADRDRVLEKLGTHRNITKQIDALQEEKKTASEQLARLQGRLEKATNAQREFDAAVEGLWTLVGRLAERTTTWAKQVEDLSHKKLVVEVIPEGNLQEVRGALDAVSKGTGSQESTRSTNLESALSHEAARLVLERLRTEAHAIVRWRTQKSTRRGDAPTAEHLSQMLGASAKISSAVLQLLDVDRFESLATSVPHPRVSLSYHDGEKLISFEKASDGQRASALLMMLLEQKGGPLIVDQPEGDLDNKVVMEITEALHTAKQHRQLLFASHNANIVVNGAAEHVCLAEPDGSGLRVLEKRGAIDDPIIRDAITSTMEGGKRAFQDRQYKYGY